MSAGIVIIGGGISGLATAYFLSKRGMRCTVIEKSGRLGGLIQTELVQGCRIEAGPDSYLAAKPSVTQLAEELELRDRIIGSNDARRRIFVVRGGRLVPFPKGMVMIAPAEWMPALQSELFSTQTKLRFLAETRQPPRQRDDDFSVATLVEDHFGKEVLEYVAEPLLAGVYGGDSAHLSARSVLPRFAGYERKYGSLIKGVRGERRLSSHSSSLFLSFHDGMQELPDSLQHAVTGWTTIVHAEAKQVERREGGGWRVETQQGPLDADEIVLACPAFRAAGLIESSAPALAAELAAIPYSSAILATLVYERSKLAHKLDGFGFLVPRAERRTISAATWVSTKFPSRIRQDLAALRAFIVAPQASELVEEPDSAIVQLARDDFQRLMGIETAPLFTSVHFWPRSMPQYVVGHEQRRLRITQMLTDFPGLHLAGNAYDGVGIPDCVRLAKEIALKFCG